jgi:hypothetical protein
MDVCLPELVETEDDLPPPTASSLLADRWILLWSTANVERQDPRHETKKATHSLCAALPLVTSEEARLN